MTRIRLTALIALVAVYSLTACSYSLAQVGEEEKGLWAQQSLQGRLGLDLNTYDFKNELKDTTAAYPITRSRLSHFLDLELSGPLISSEFMQYALLTTIRGIYFTTNSDALSNSTYSGPSLTNYDAELTLFPQKRYPLRLFKGRLKDKSLIYEETFRNETDVQRPGLVTLRRYEIERSSEGASLTANISEAVNAVSGYRRNESVSTRTYEFDENRDIWVDVQPDLPDPLKVLDTVTISNQLSGVDIRVIIDQNINLLISQGLDEAVELSPGIHSVSVIPLSYYRQYEFSVTVNANAAWKVIYVPPAGGNDRREEEDNIELGLSIDGGRKYKVRSDYSYEDGLETFRGQSDKKHTFNNNIDWRLSRSLRMTAETLVSSGKSELGVISSRSDRLLSQRTTVTRGELANTIINVSHSYSRNSQEAKGSPNSSSTLNEITSSVELPVKQLSQRVKISTLASFLSTSTELSKNLYTSAIQDHLDFVTMGMRLKPNVEVSYSITNQKGPDVEARQFRVNSRLASQIINPPIVDDFRMETGARYERNTSETSGRTEKQYQADVIMNKNIGAKAQLNFLTSHKYRIQSVSQETEGFDVGEVQQPDVTIYDATYSVSLRFKPNKELMISPGYTATIGESGTVQQYTLGLETRLPLIGAPLNSFLRTQIRDFEGLEQQTTVDLETKLLFAFREIYVRLKHEYSREKLLTSVFTFHEIRAEIVRRISAF